MSVVAVEVGGEKRSEREGSKRWSRKRVPGELLFLREPAGRGLDGLRSLKPVSACFISNDSPGQALLSIYLSGDGYSSYVSVLKRQGCPTPDCRRISSSPMLPLRQ